MNTIRLLLSIIVYYTNTYSVLSQQSNHTEFIASVCNTSNLYYDSCSCDLSKSLALTDNLTCFNSFNCPYNSQTHTFCSANGYCDFTDGACVCNEEYGSFDCSQKYTLFLPNQAILILMISIASCLLLLSISLQIWMHLYRDVGDVKAMSVVFTHLTLVGCTLICCGTIVMGLGFDQANCVILEWFHFLGICIVISCALLKSYRIASIFGQSTFSPSDLTDTVLLKYFSVMIIVNIFFLGIYTIFNFVEGGAYTRYILDTVKTEIRCSSEPLTMLSYSLLVSWQLVLLLFVIKYGNQTRSASKIFKETKCIYVGSNIGSMFFIAFGIFVLFTTNYTLQIVIRGYGSLIVVMMVIGLLFYPKFKTVYNLRLIKNKKHNQQQIIDENGNVINEEEAALKRQYEAHVKDPNGKELLLLLDAIVKEIQYRANMKMLSIELGSVDLKKCNALIHQIKGLIPDENVVNDVEKDTESKPKVNDNYNDEKDNELAPQSDPKLTDANSKDILINSTEMKVTPMGITTETEVKLNEENIVKNTDSGKHVQMNTIGLDDDEQNEIDKYIHGD
eukprot:541784_1